MTVRLIIDINLSPEWVPFLAEAGVIARHWAQVGDPTATDREIMAWARTHGYTVFTHDRNRSEPSGRRKRVSDER